MAESSLLIVSKPIPSSLRRQNLSWYCSSGTGDPSGEQPGKVLRRAGLAGAEWNEPASVTALFMAAQKHIRIHCGVEVTE
jgi:hypothetical protein